jgi:hypothetical protein
MLDRMEKQLSQEARAAVAEEQPEVHQSQSSILPFIS